MPDLATAKNLAVSYNGREALRGIDLSLQAGEWLALLGPNGCGKSTLIKAMIGLVKSTGRVSWQGRDLAHFPQKAIARLVAYLPQSPTFEPLQSVLDVLRLGRYPYWGAFGIESTDDTAVIQAIAEHLGLVDLLDRPMDQLSGGQRQRVFVGRCLVQQPQALLLDEPNTFLDLRHQIELCKMLKALTREQNLGVLMAVHDLNLAALFADRVLLLHEGRLLAAGRPADILASADLPKAYGIAVRPVGGGLVVPVVDNDEGSVNP